MKNIIVIPTLLSLSFLLYLSVFHTPHFYPKQVGMNSIYVFGDKLSDIIKEYKYTSLQEYTPIQEYNTLIKLVFFSSLVVERITDDQLKRVEVEGVLIEDHEDRADIIEARKEIRRDLYKKYRIYKKELTIIKSRDIIIKNRDIINEVFNTSSYFLEKEVKKGIFKEKIGDFNILEYVFGRYIEYIIKQKIENT